MKRVEARTRAARRVLAAFACLAALTPTACDNEINFNPTAPTVPFTSTTSSRLGDARNLDISGTLTAEHGACLEATVLLDGEELSGARTTCSESSGCTTVRIAAKVQTGTGHHTIAFQVLRQSLESVSYTAQGTVRVTRDGLPALSLTMPLGPTRTSLGAGESVPFEVEFSN